MVRSQFPVFSFNVIWESHLGFSMNSHTCFLLVCKEGQSRSFNIFVTIPGSHFQQFLTKHADLLWTASICLICLSFHGSQTELLYSKCGRTNDLHDNSLTDSGHFPRFLLKNSKVRFALLTFISIWCPQSSTRDVHPKVWMV